MPGRQLQGWVGLEAAQHPHCDPVPVQVVALGDLPVQLDAAALGRLRGEYEGLIDRQQILFVDRQGGKGGQGQQA